MKRLAFILILVFSTSSTFAQSFKLDSPSDGWIADTTPSPAPQEAQDAQEPNFDSADAWILDEGKGVVNDAPRRRVEVSKKKKLQVTTTAKPKTTSVKTVATEPIAKIEVKIKPSSFGKLPVASKNTNRVSPTLIPLFQDKNNMPESVFNDPTLSDTHKTQADFGFSTLPENMRPPSLQPRPINAPCTDLNACLAKLYPPSPAEQARQLATAAYFNNVASSTWTPTIEDGGSGETLTYADMLSRFLNVGRKAYVRGRPLCAKAVRLILQASGLLNRDGQQPEGAKDYVPYLENHGFVNRPEACNSPGVVRVYGASLPSSPYYVKTNSKGRRISKRPRGSTSGDFYGHIEILGTDKKFHHFATSSINIQQIFTPDRRPLIGCMVKENWSSK